MNIELAALVEDHQRYEGFVNAHRMSGNGEQDSYRLADQDNLVARKILQRLSKRQDLQSIVSALFENRNSITAHRQAETVIAARDADGTLFVDGDTLLLRAAIALAQGSHRRASTLIEIADRVASADPSHNPAYADNDDEVPADEELTSVNPIFESANGTDNVHGYVVVSDESFGYADCPDD